MGIPGSANPMLLGGAAGYEIEQSLRFDGSAQLTRTVGNNGGSRSFTFSVWLKKSIQGDTNFTMLKSMASDDSEWAYFNFGESSGDADQISCRSKTSGGYAFSTSPARKYRDPSSWMHLVLKVDKSANTATGYVNGEQVGGTAGAGGWTFNKDVTGDNLHLGPNLDGYLAEAVFVDNQALDPDSFGEYDDNNVWRPIAVSGLSFGTNGWYLKFDPSATNGIGHDHSGNGNHFTASGFTTNPSSYSLAYVSSGSFDNNELLVDAIDKTTNTNAGVTTSSASSNTDVTITFDPPLNGDITIHNVDDRTGVSATGAYYKLKDSDGVTLITQAPPTGSTPDYTHNSLSDVATLELHGGNGAYGGISIGGVESSGNTIRTAYQLSLGDVVEDTPTKNWCTLNPLDRSSSSPTLSNGNLDIKTSTRTAVNESCRGTVGVSAGKWYFECVVTPVYVAAFQAGEVGIKAVGTSLANRASDASDAFCFGVGGGGSTWFKRNNSTFTNLTTSGATTGTVLSVAFDLDAGKVWVAKDGAWENSGNPASGTNAQFTSIASGTYAVVVTPYSSTTSNYTDLSLNTGQRAFAYTPPTGFNALNTANLPAPDIADGSDYFNTVLWTGDGASSRSISGVGFQPDWVWTKKRNSAQDHFLYDVVRGSTNGNFYELRSSSTAAEGVPSTADTGLRSLDSDGFTIGSDGSVNTNNDTYVAWSWDAGGSGSSNTAGSITSTVSANPSAGFSIVSYTGNATSGATVGHGLGAAPSMLITKNRDSTSEWGVYHSALGGTKALLLNQNYNQQTNSLYWNNTNPSSTVFTLGAGSTTNSSSDYIAYCFAEVEGFSKFGSYTGNGSTDGPFVYCGFRPAWIMIKVTNVSTTAWMIRDTGRNPYNIATGYLMPNLSSAEFTNLDFDICSNGFKPRHTNNVENSSGSNYIFAAFAEHPFGGDGVSPATAR